MSRPANTGFQSDKAVRRLRRRRAADARFRLYGLGALGFAMLALVFLMTAIVWKAAGAVTYHIVRTDITLAPDHIVPEGNAAPEEITRNVEGFYTLVRDDLLRGFPEAASSAEARREFGALIDRLAVLPLARQVAHNPALIGQTVTVVIRQRIIRIVDI